MQKEGKQPLGHTAYELTDIYAGKLQEETDQMQTAIISSETNIVQNEKGVEVNRKNIYWYRQIPTTVK